jgi:hypothetical protein
MPAVSATSAPGRESRFQEPEQRDRKPGRSADTPGPYSAAVLADQNVTANVTVDTAGDATLLGLNQDRLARRLDTERALQSICPGDIGFRHLHVSGAAVRLVGDQGFELCSVPRAEFVVGGS